MDNSKKKKYKLLNHVLELLKQDSELSQAVQVVETSLTSDNNPIVFTWMTHAKDRLLVMATLSLLKKWAKKGMVEEGASQESKE